MPPSSKLRNANCTLCPLSSNANHVCMMGIGDSHADIMVVGDCPGEREDYSGKPFQGKLGQLLDSILFAFDLTREDIYLTNAVHCRPPGTGKPTANQIQVCSREYLVAEVRRVRPKVILALGAIAAEALLGEKIPVTSSRLKTFHTSSAYPKTPVVVSFHPGAALRNDYLTEKIVQDFEYLLKELENGFKAPEREVLDYQLVEDLSQVPGLSQATCVAIDLETDGLSPFVKGRRILSVQVSCKHGTGYFAYWTPLVKSQVKAIVEDASIIKVNQNLKFDLKWLRREGIVCRGPIRCTLIEAHLLDENLRDKSLDALASQFTSLKSHKDGLKEYRKKHKCSHIEVPPEILIPYGCADADAALRLDKVFYPRIKAEGLKPLLNLEMKALKMFVGIESNGWKIDVPLIDELIDIYEKRIDERVSELTKILGYTINDRSPKQLMELLYVKWKLPPMGVVRPWENKDGYDTTEYTITRLLTLEGLRDSRRAFLEGLLFLRENRKVLSTYLLGLADNLTHKGFVHPNFRLDGTVTGRLSCTDPNFQNIPRLGDIKRLFISRYGSEGLVSQFDLSQAELRFGAHLSGEPTLTKLFIAGGADIHREVAAEVLGKHPSKVTAEERKKAKTVNFGIFYGAQAKKMAETMQCSVKDADKFIKAWFKRFPGWPIYERQVKRSAIENGRVVSPFGRIRHLPIIDPSSVQGAEALRQAVNSPIQGGVCDYTLVGGTQALAKIRRAGLKRTHFVAQVHDAWILDVHKDEVKEVEAIMKETHENPDLSDFGFKMKVPMVIEPAFGPNWKEVKANA